MNETQKPDYYSEKRAFVIEYLMSRARTNNVGLCAGSAVNEALKAWDRIEKECGE